MIKIYGFSRYLVDKEGFIHSLGFEFIDKKGRRWRKRPARLKGSVGKSGHVGVTLIDDDGHKKRLFVHRIVAAHFIANPYSLPMINHKDGNPRNNHYENLEWCTQSMNMQHCFYELKKQSHRNKPIIQIDSCGNIVSVWPSVNMASKRLGYKSTGAIWAVLKGKSSHANGFRWQYQ